jgi:hypothetical protein
VGAADNCQQQPRESPNGQANRARLIEYEYARELFIDRRASSASAQAGSVVRWLHPPLNAQLRAVPSPPTESVKSRARLKRTSCTVATEAKKGPTGDGLSQCRNWRSSAQARELLIRPWFIDIETGPQASASDATSVDALGGAPVHTWQRHARDTDQGSSERPSSSSAAASVPSPMDTAIGYAPDPMFERLH